MCMCESSSGAVERLCCGQHWAKEMCPDWLISEVDLFRNSIFRLIREVSLG